MARFNQVVAQQAPFVGAVEGSPQRGNWTGFLAGDARFAGLIFQVSVHERNIIQLDIRPRSKDAPFVALTSRFMRELPIGVIRAAALADLHHAAERLPGFSPSVRQDSGALFEQWSHGQIDARLRRHAEVARVYRDLVRSGERNVKDELAARCGYSKRHLAEMLTTARREGLLTPPPRPGVAGGDLTEKALDLLARED